METQITIGGRKTVNPQELIALRGEINYTTVYFLDENERRLLQQL
jgi:hypothetical protein